MLKLYIVLLIVFSNTSFLISQEKSKVVKHYKTTGVFVQANFDNPLALEVGKRVKPSLYLGGQLSLPINVTRQGTIFGETTSTNFGEVFGLAAYSKYFITRNPHRANLFTDAFLGIAIGESDDSVNNPKPYGGIALGVHIPNKKLIRFYFDAGLYTIMNQVETVLQDPQSTIVSSNRFELLFQLTLIGIEF